MYYHTQPTMVHTLFQKFLFYKLKTKICKIKKLLKIGKFNYLFFFVKNMKFSQTLKRTNKHVEIFF